VLSHKSIGNKCAADIKAVVSRPGTVVVSVLRPVAVFVNSKRVLQDFQFFVHHILQSFQPNYRFQPIRLRCAPALG
jgi:hypothetical protein